MHVCIRPWTATDAPAIVEALSDAGVTDNLRDGLPKPYTEADARDYIAYARTAGEGAYAFAIDAGGEAAGSIQLTRQGNIHRRTAELGYYVVRRLWGRGVCTEAVRQICRFAFAETDLLRVYAEPFADNAASCRVLEKAGFRLEGVMMHSAVKNGVVRDMRLYSLLREDLECIGS